MTDKSDRPDEMDENYVIATPKREKKTRATSRRNKGQKSDAEQHAEASKDAEDSQTAEGASAAETATDEKANGKATDKTTGKDTGSSGADGKDGTSGTTPAPKANKRKKHLITLGVVVVVLVAAGAGFMAWHETPSFCGAICHTPMDPYMPTYYSEPGEQGVDKWGNTVDDSDSMLAAQHREYADMACMDCHVPSLEEQITEGMEWVGGDYYYPLNERDLSRLVYYRGVGETEFCLNESCHNMTKSDLTEATSECTRNPHSWHHAEYTCSDCHKAHRASVMVCSQCHQDYELPEGWITWQEAQDLETIYGQYEDLEAESEE
jgi:hypothetical protein